MKLDDLFDKLNTGFEDLWNRVQTLAEQLNVSSGDEEYFLSNDAAKLSCYIEAYKDNLIAISTHIARVKKVKHKLQAEAEQILGSEYVRITEEGPPSNVSIHKFDQEYRKGKSLGNRRYQVVTEWIADLIELEATLEGIKNSLQLKATVLPTMFKLEKDKF